MDISTVYVRNNDVSIALKDVYTIVKFPVCSSLRRPIVGTTTYPQPSSLTSPLTTTFTQQQQPSDVKMASNQALLPLQPQAHHPIQPMLNPRIVALISEPKPVIMPQELLEMVLEEATQVMNFQEFLRLKLVSSTC
jgi:hypothetical protein